MEEAGALARLAEALDLHRGGNGCVRLKVDLSNGEADVILGRDFRLDAELAARLERMDGVGSVRLSAMEGLRLASAA